MISFLQYLIESIETKEKDRKYLRHQIKNILSTSSNLKQFMLDNNFNEDFIIRNNHSNEILRASLGKDYNIAKQCVQLIVDEFNKLDHSQLNSKMSLNQDQESYSVKSREVASGTFKSFEIKYNENIFYITNIDSVKGNLKNKQFVPNKLNLIKNQNFTNVDDIIQTIESSQVFSKKSPFINFIKDNILDKFKSKNFKKITVIKDGCCDKSTIDDVFNISASDKKTGKIILKNIIEKNNLINASILKDNDINVILKDLGEVIGPLIFLNLYNDVKVSYPTNSNMPLIDYYLISKTNTYKISAKANNGAKPSGSLIFSNEQLGDILNDKIKFNNLILNKIDNKDINLLSKNEKNATPSEIREFITFLITNFKKSVFEMQYNLIKNYAIPELKDSKEIKMLSDNIFKFDTLTNTNNSIENFVLAINNFFKDKNNFENNKAIKEFFENLYKKLNNYKPKKYPIKWLEQNFLTCKFSNIKIGVLFYPLYKYAVNVINNKYCNKNINILSKIIHNTIDIKQVYLSIKDQDLVLDVRFSTYSNWKFAVSNISTNKIFNQHLAIELIK